MRTADKKLELPRFTSAGWCFLKQPFDNQRKTFTCRYVTIWLWMEKCTYYVWGDVSWRHIVYWGPSYSPVTESSRYHIEIRTDVTAAWCREAFLQCYSCNTKKLCHSWDSPLLFSFGGKKQSFMCIVYKRCSVSSAQVSADVCDLSLISGLL